MIASILSQKILKLNKEIQLFKISQRRYLGNKNSILPFIDNIIKDEIGHFNSFCDIFAGTGSLVATSIKKIIKLFLMIYFIIILYQ